MYNNKSIMEKYDENSTPEHSGGIGSIVHPPEASTTSSEPSHSVPSTAPSPSVPSTEPSPSDDCAPYSDKWKHCNSSLYKLFGKTPDPNWWNPKQGCHNCPIVNAGETLEDKLPLPDDCTKNNLRWKACNKILNKEKMSIGTWKEHLWNSGEVCHKCPMTDTRNQLLENVENLPDKNRTSGQSCRIQEQCAEGTTCTNYNRCLDNSKLYKTPCDGKCEKSDECANDRVCDLTCKNRNNTSCN